MLKKIKNTIRSVVTSENEKNLKRNNELLDLHFQVPPESDIKAITGYFQLIEQMGHRISLHYERLEVIDEPLDCIITAGNSYGHMTGGIDKAVVAVNGLEVQQRVLETIGSQYLGELNVGQAITVYDQYWKIPHVIYAPTMRVPMLLGHHTDIPYLAMLAALQEIRRLNKADTAGIYTPFITRIYIPYFGAGTGGLPIEIVMNQIVVALARYTAPALVDDLFKDGRALNDAIHAWSK